MAYFKKSTKTRENSPAIKIVYGGALQGRMEVFEVGAAAVNFRRRIYGRIIGTAPPSPHPWRIHVNVYNAVSALPMCVRVGLLGFRVIDSFCRVWICGFVAFCGDYFV